MSNYIEIYLDKTSGKLVAKSNAGGGNTNGFTHEQTTPASIWTVTHSKNSLNLVYQVHDSLREHLIPDSFKIIDANTVEVSFGIPQTGFLQLIII